MKFLELSGNKLTVAGILAFILLSGLVLIRVGVFSIDESTMLLGFDGLSKSGKLKIFNDYESFKVPELNAYKGVVNGDELYVSYAPLYFYLLLPIYVAFGPFGLIIINLMAAAISVFIFYRLTVDITGNESIAVKTILLFVFTTFFFEYTIAIWPHMLTMMLILLTVYLFRMGITGAGAKDFMFFYAGLFLGVAAGIRSSSMIILFLLIFLVFWEKNDCLKRIGLMILGIYPPLGFISFINHRRFNTINPVANNIGSNFDIQGVNIIVPVMVIFLSIYMIFLHYFLSKYFKRDNSASKGKIKTERLQKISVGILSAGGLVIILAVIFHFREFYGYGKNFLGYLFNSYFVPKLPYEGAVYIEPGLLTYLGVIKKAVLQSCPFLILIFTAPYILGKTEGILRSDKRLVSLFCFGIPLFYSLFNFHGGMGFNGRYFLELLPWGTLIAVLWIERSKITSQLIEVFVFSIVLFALVLSFTQDSSLVSKIIIVIVPSILAFSLLLSVGLSISFPRIKLYNAIISFIIVISLSIGFSFEYFKDLPAVLSKRTENVFKANVIEKILPERAFLFIYWGFKDPVASVKLKKQIIVADYNLSPHGNPFPFLEKALSSNIPVYLYGEGVHPELMEILKMEYNLSDVSKEIIPIYHITRKSRVF